MGDTGLYGVKGGDTERLGDCTDQCTTTQPWTSLNVIKPCVVKSYGLRFDTTSRTAGRISAPRRFFVDSGKTATRSAAKFCMTIPSSFLHIMCKL